jgi:hypothetical protein
MTSTDKVTIIIRQIAGGWAVLRHKTYGTEKGYTTLANTCGGVMGRVLAIECAKRAAGLCMADEVILEREDGVNMPINPAGDDREIELENFAIKNMSDEDLAAAVRKGNKK